MIRENTRMTKIATHWMTRRREEREEEEDEGEEEVGKDADEDRGVCGKGRR